MYLKQTTPIKIILIGIFKLYFIEEATELAAIWPKMLISKNRFWSKNYDLEITILTKSAFLKS